MQTGNDKSSEFLERRRQLLRMGAAGMPMLLTLRASAREAVVSQLRCVITMPGSLKILVDNSGAAWVGDGSLQQASSKGKGKGKGKGKKGWGSGSTGWTQSSIDDFKSNANWVFPAGSAPAAYRPDACEEDECEDNWSDDSSGWWDDNSDLDLVSHLSDQNETYAANDIVAGNSGNSYWGGGWGDDDCGHNQGDDDSGSSHSHSQGIVDCGYACYEYSQNQSITPGDYVTQGGSLNITGDDGLYLALSMIYADQYGANGDFPGVSCIVSVLNYIGQ